MKTWKPWPGCDCPDCGNSTEVLSDADAPDGFTTDGDAVRCSDPACPRHTQDAEDQARRRMVLGRRMG